MKRAEWRRLSDIPGSPPIPTVSVDNRGDLLDHLKQLPQPHAWDEWLASEAPIEADYRESLSPLDAGPYGEVTDR